VYAETEQSPRGGASFFLFFEKKFWLAGGLKGKSHAKLLMLACN